MNVCVTQSIVARTEWGVFFLLFFFFFHLLRSAAHTLIAVSSLFDFEKSKWVVIYNRVVIEIKNTRSFHSTLRMSWHAHNKKSNLSLLVLFIPGVCRFFFSPSVLFLQQFFFFFFALISIIAILWVFAAFTRSQFLCSFNSFRNPKWKEERLCVALTGDEDGECLPRFVFLFSLFISSLRSTVL